VSTPTRGISGKLLILAVVTLALAAAAASWWFRYAATHQAAQFWGREFTRLIRDAPYVTLIQMERTPAPDLSGFSIFDLPEGVTAGESWRIVSERDISSAAGLTHLRAALLEDRSFDWPVPDSPPATDWKVQLQFRDSMDADAASVTVFFSPQFRWAFAANERDSTNRAISCRPIAKGLQTFFADERQSPPPGR